MSARGKASSKKPDSIPRTVSTSSRDIALSALVIVAASLIAYHNTFSVPFLFDDWDAIAQNTSIRHLWPIWSVLVPPQGDFTVSGRPMVNLSLAINYAFGGGSVRGYHVFNLAIHILAGLTLFGIVRRTLLKPRLRERFGPSASGLALVIAGLWAVHPLQTESVTYIVQRAESLMGLFYLLTLYCFIRGTESRPAGWQALAIAACLCGMATKQVMISAPGIVFLYDRTFVAGTFREALRRRWRFYLGLGSTALLLGWLAFSSGSLDAGTAGFDSTISRHGYGLTQLWAITHYLWLSVWPQSLVLDYGGPVLIGAGRALPCALIVIPLLAASAISVRRWPAIGFVGAWFFGILALTSSVFPLNDTIFEHRMYLPLAAVIVVLVLALHAWLGRWSRVVFAVATVAFIVLTVRRNRDYQTELAIWTDTVAKRPDNARAQNNLGHALFEARRMDDVRQHYQTALALESRYASVHNNPGAVPAATGKADEAIAAYRRALELRPGYPDAHNNLGVALANAGRMDEAIEHYRRALQGKPEFPQAHYNLGNALAGRGQFAEAADQYRAAVRANPDYAEAYGNLGNALAAQDRIDEAMESYARALQKNPRFAIVHHNLGNALANRGQLDDAIRHYRDAIAIAPDYANAHRNLAEALALKNQLPEALAEYNAALRLNPNDASAHFGLGRALARAGRAAEAVAQLSEALRLQPDFPGAKQALQAIGNPP